MRVRGHRGDPGHAEVERRDWVAQAPRERQYEAAEAAVYVEAALFWRINAMVVGGGDRNEASGTPRGGGSVTKRRRRGDIAEQWGLEA